MKCHYEILNVTQSATDDELKKAYRKLALKWHPDKNPDCKDEAKEQFQLIQQAYDILSDSQERAWYDSHREAILKGGLGKEFVDDSINVFQYFTTTCFKGYDDSDQGFYSVYRELFKQLAAEESEFYGEDDSDFEIPEFGYSDSDYSEVVHPFYCFWQSFATKRTFSWLDEYDTRTAPNRRISRLMEKENKKIRDGAKKERNEGIRALVAFVRKRDKRVQLHVKQLEEIAAANAKRLQELRVKQLKQRQEEISAQKECDWSKFSNFEKELEEIEANLAAEFKDHSEESINTDEDDEPNNTFYCPACNKLFKTEKAFSNHEKSKKHKERVDILQKEILLEDNDFLDNCDIDLNSSESDQAISLATKKKKKVKKKKTILLNKSDSDEDNLDNDNNIGDSSTIIECSSGGKVDNMSVNEIPDDNSKTKKSKRNKTKKHVTPLIVSPSDVSDSAHICKVCLETFNSNNELFKHLKSSGHAVPLSETKLTESGHAPRSKKKSKK